MTIYRIRDWREHFENNRTKELKRMTWVPVPNKHDGDGFTELLDHPNGMAHYGAWHLILQVASKCDPRGSLLRDGAEGGKTAHTPQSLARITRGSAVVFSEALPRLLKIGWIETCEYAAPSCGNPAVISHLTDYGMEGNGMEQNGKREDGTAALSPEVGIPSLQEVIDYGAKWAGDMHRGVPAVIPADFCEHYHGVCTDKRRWVTSGGQMLSWQTEMPRWWSRDWRNWKAKGGNGTQAGQDDWTKSL